MTKARASTAVIAVAVVAGACATASAPLPIAGARDEYRSALTAIVDAFERFGLPRVDVRLILFRNRSSFEDGLLSSGYPRDLARSASEFAAIGGARAILANAAVVNRLARRERMQLIAHELVHSLQYQFSGGTRGASEQWLREGFAEWVSYRVTDDLGLDSFQRQRDEMLDRLGALRFGAAPAPLDALVTFPQWVQAQRDYELVYQQAFIGAELLIEQHGVPAVVGYFERFRHTTDHVRAFADAFGVDRAAFERDFTRRWRQIAAQMRARG